MNLVKNLRNLCLVLFIALLVFVQPVRSEVDKAELHQALLDLTNPWTVMCVAAHPDDEDGSTLTILRRKYGVHTVSLFLPSVRADRTRSAPNSMKISASFVRAKQWLQLKSRALSHTSLASAILVFQSLLKRLFARGVRKNFSDAWCSRFVCFVPM